MLLEGKSAVVYGAGGSIGGAVARVFAREGANLFLAGRTAAKLESVVDEIRAAGGQADAAALDALDERAVDEHADAGRASRELGGHGVRVVTLRTGGVPESIPPSLPRGETIAAGIAGRS